MGSTSSHPTTAMSTSEEDPNKRRPTKLPASSRFEMVTTLLVNQPQISQLLVQQRHAPQWRALCAYFNIFRPTVVLVWAA